jgi:predicted PP-loop superfamily ATPase
MSSQWDLVFQKINSANGDFLNLNCSQYNHLIHKGVFGYTKGEEATREEKFCFGPFESHACKFGCPVITYIVSKIFHYKRYYTNRLM